MRVLLCEKCPSEKTPYLDTFHIVCLKIVALKTLENIQKNVCNGVPF